VFTICRQCHHENNETDKTIQKRNINSQTPKKVFEKSKVACTNRSENKLLWHKNQTSGISVAELQTGRPKQTHSCFGDREAHG